ncbi:MAG: tetratricopeptide repeat protein, partial [Kamptonema sp. SIO4C4]|nr:tetratricopeptide repeat protein [Kamptonema sp. SIO4C4]
MIMSYRRRGLGVLTSIGVAFFTFAPPVIAQPKQVLDGLYTNDLDAATLFQKGVMQYQQQLFADAEIAFRQALRYDPLMAMSYYMLGNSLMQQGEVEEAIEHYRQAT